MTSDPDFTIGHRIALGSYHFTEEAIIEFARKYDPQPFHTDPEAARNSLFGGLCASGWHTTAVWMKLNVATTMKRFEDRARNGWPVYEFGPSPGFRNLRWIRPVYAGQTISYFNTLTAIKPYKGRKDWSILTGSAEALDEGGSPVMTFDSAVLSAYPSAETNGG